MEWIGLLVECLFLILGIYVYLFSRGFVKFSDESSQEKAEAFRNDNQTLLRLLSLALIAIMGLNIFLHLRTLLG